MFEISHVKRGYIVNTNNLRENDFDYFGFLKIDHGRKHTMNDSRASFLFLLRFARPLTHTGL